jgi:hypothetical protein
MAMHGSHAIRVGSAADGTRTYLIDLAPEALPPVRGRDLTAAWARARNAAAASARGAPLRLRFRRDDGAVTDLALGDTDACCWAAAVEASAGMASCHGVSVLLRLLALVDLLGRARWTAGLFTLSGGEADLHPALLRAAATTPLTAEAGFDETHFRARIAEFRGPGVECGTARRPAADAVPVTPGAPGVSP